MNHHPAVIRPTHATVGIAAALVSALLLAMGVGPSFTHAADKLRVCEPAKIPEGLDDYCYCQRDGGWCEGVLYREDAGRVAVISFVHLVQPASPSADDDYFLSGFAPVAGSLTIDIQKELAEVSIHRKKIVGAVYQMEVTRQVNVGPFRIPWKNAVFPTLRELDHEWAFGASALNIAAQMKAGRNETYVPLVVHQQGDIPLFGCYEVWIKVGQQWLDPVVRGTRQHPTTSSMTQPSGNAFSKTDDQRPRRLDEKNPVRLVWDLRNEEADWYTIQLGRRPQSPSTSTGPERAGIPTGASGAEHIYTSISFYHGDFGQSAGRTQKKVSDTLCQ